MKNLLFIGTAILLSAFATTSIASGDVKFRAVGKYRNAVNLSSITITSKPSSQAGGVPVGGCRFTTKNRQFTPNSPSSGGTQCEPGTLLKTMVGKEFIIELRGQLQLCYRSYTISQSGIGGYVYTFNYSLTGNNVVRVRANPVPKKYVKMYGKYVYTCR